MISQDCWPILRRYEWPGNVRELRAEVSRWAVFCDTTVEPEDLSFIKTPGASGPMTLAQAVERAERGAIEIAMEENEGNISKAAKMLAIDRNTLKRKLDRFGLR